MAKQLVFIASGGRTGTQFFGHMLGSVISDCYSEHEPDMVVGLSRLTLQRVRRFGIWHMVIGRLLGRTGVRNPGQAMLEGTMDQATGFARLRAARRAYHASRPESLIVESYASWWMVAEVIDQIFPGAKLAGVLRDPRDWITSWQRHEPDRRRGALVERLPPGPLTPERLGDARAAALWPDLDQVGRMAWEWRLISKKLSDAAETCSNVRIFRFEDLFGPDPASFRDFAGFIAEHPHGPRHQIGDLKAITGQVRNASKGAGTGWTDWTDAQVAAVNHFCGNVMAAHGYGHEAEWLERVAKAGSL